MGQGRLPRDPKEQTRWARQLTSGLNVPPIDVFRWPRQSLGIVYRRIFCEAYRLGAEAALREVLAELDRSDDPLASLPPHLVKSAKAAARAQARKRAARSEQEGKPAATAQRSPRRRMAA